MSKLSCPSQEEHSMIVKKSIEGLPHSVRLEFVRKRGTHGNICRRRFQRGGDVVVGVQVEMSENGNGSTQRSEVRPMSYVAIIQR